MSEVWYSLVIAVVVLARLIELGVARRHLAWARSHGGVEFGAGHYPVMVFLHVALLVGCVVETWVLDAPFFPVLAGVMAVLLVVAHLLRWWCIRTLGMQWNTRVVIVPGLPLVHRGPYRFLRHPNYVAVVLEGVALPLVHGAYWTAIGFTVCNAVLLHVRIRVEDRALRTVAG